MSNDKPQTPTLPGVIDGAITARLKNLRVAMPARVETYDAATQSCSCQPLVYDGYFDETGRRQAEKLPVVTSVPVCFPGSGGFRVTFPLSTGDTVLLVFASSSIDRWLANGGEVDPIDDRRHHLTDAIAIPGLRDLSHAVTGVPSTTMSIGKTGGPTIEIGTDIRAGGSNNLVLRSEFLAHTHATAGTGTPSPPIAGPSGSSSTFPGTQTLKGG